MSALDTTAQRARARTVLLAAADLYRARRGALWQCIQAAAVDLLDAEFARRVLRGVLFESNIVAWEQHPTRRRSDVWRVLWAAVRWCSRRSGGWRVGGAERPSAPRVPPSRQWLEWMPRGAR